MRDTDRGRRLVDVLSACPARTVRIDTQIVHIDLDIDILLDIRHDITAHERCLTLARRIERGNPNKTVYTLFGLQIAIGVRTVYLECHRLNTRFISVQIVKYFDREALFIRPSRVHPV